MAGRINKSMLSEELSKVQYKSLEKKAKDIANKILEEEKAQYISQIMNHPISQELSAGPDSSNISNTLNGQGNLYSFIGFNAGDTPIENLVDIVKKNTFIKMIKASNSGFDFEVNSPSLEELKTFTPMPFEGGNSWLKGIEKGISGFSNYLYGKLFPNSRSGKGIQSANKIRITTYKPTKYFSALYKNFIDSFK